jgi:hypothetical protein
VPLDRAAFVRMARFGLLDARLGAGVGLKRKGAARLMRRRTR